MSNNFLESSCNLNTYKQKAGSFWDKLYIRYCERRIRSEMKSDMINIGSILGGVVATKEIIKENPLSFTESQFYRSLVVGPSKKDIERSKEFHKILEKAEEIKELYTKGKVENEGDVEKTLMDVPKSLTKLPVLFFSKYAYQMSAAKYNDGPQAFNMKTKKKYANILTEVEMEKYKLYVGEEKEASDSMDKIFDESPERLFKRCKYMLSRLEGVSSKMNNLFVIQGKKGKMKLKPANFVEKCKEELFDIHQNVKNKGDYTLKYYKRLMDMKNKVNKFIEKSWESFIPVVNSQSRKVISYTYKEIVLPLSKTRVDLGDLQEYSVATIKQLSEERSQEKISIVEKVNRLFLVNNMLEMYTSSLYGEKYGKSIGYLNVVDEYQHKKQLRRVVDKLNFENEKKACYFSDIVDIASGNSSGMKRKIKKYRIKDGELYPIYNKNKKKITEIYNNHKENKEEFNNILDFMPKTYKKEEFSYGSFMKRVLREDTETVWASLFSVMLNSNGIWKGLKEKLKEKDTNVKYLFEHERLKEESKGDAETCYIPFIKNNPDTKEDVISGKKNRFVELVKTTALYSLCIILPFYYISGIQLHGNKEKKEIKKEEIKHVVKVDSRDILHSDKYSIYFTNKKYDYYREIYHDSKKLEKEHRELHSRINYYENYKKNDQIIRKVFHDHLKKVLKITNNRRIKYYKQYLNSRNIEYLEKCRDYTKEILNLDSNIKLEAIINRLDSNTYYSLSSNDVMLFSKQEKIISNYLKKNDI